MFCNLTIKIDLQLNFFTTDYFITYLAKKKKKLQTIAWYVSWTPLKLNFLLTTWHEMLTKKGLNNGYGSVHMLDSVKEMDGQVLKNEVLLLEHRKSNMLCITLLSYMSECHQRSAKTIIRLNTTIFLKIFLQSFR